MRLLTTVSLQIGLTHIVRQWMSGQIVNKGIVLKKREGRAPLVCFGSAVTRDITLVPTLKIFFTKERLPITELNCSYIIVPPIKSGF